MRKRKARLRITLLTASYTRTAGTLQRISSFLSAAVNRRAASATSPTLKLCGSDYYTIAGAVMSPNFLPDLLRLTSRLKKFIRA
jgi:hypothetical protein